MEGGDFVGRDDEGLPQRFGTRDHRDDLALDGGIVEEDVDLGLVHLLDGGRPVVHLQEQVAPRLHDMPDGRRKLERRRAWHPPPKQELLHVDAVIAKAFVPRIGVGRIQGLGLGDDVRDVGVRDQGVVVDRVVARPDFHRLHLLGLGHAGGDHKDLVLVQHVAFMNEGLGHAQHEVGLANLAVVGVRRQPGIVCGVALRHAVRHPGADDVLLGLGQKPLATQGTVVVVWRPRRHVARLGDVLDEVAVRRDFRVRGERHGADLPHPMALGALVVNDGRDVRMKRDRLGQTSRRGKRRNAHHGQSGKQLHLPKVSPGIEQGRTSSCAIGLEWQNLSP